MRPESSAGYIYIAVCFILTTATVCLCKESILFEKVEFENHDGDFGVRSIVQDSHGYLWLGTDSGLFRYDGFLVKAFAHDPSVASSLSNDDISHLLVRESGSIVIAYVSGAVDEFNPETEKTSRVRISFDQLQVKGSVIAEIVFDKAGNLWLLNIWGDLFYLPPDSEAFIKLEPPTIENNRETDQKIIKLFVVDGGIFVLNNSAQMIELVLSEEQNSFSRVLVRENLWDTQNPVERNLAIELLSCPNQASFQNKMNLTDNLLTRFTELDLDVRGVAIYDSDQVLITTHNSGLFLSEATGDGIRHFPYSNPGSSNETGAGPDRANTVFADRTESVWLGSESGLYHYSKFKNRFAANKFKINIDQDIARNITAIRKDITGNIWFGTLEGLLYKTAETGDVIRQFDFNRISSSFQNTISSILLDSNGDLYVGTMEGGLYKYLPERDSFDPVVVGIQLSSLAESAAGELLIGTYLQGFGKLNKSTGEIDFWEPGVLLAPVASSFDVTAIFEDEANTIWIGSDGMGLVQYDPESERYYVYANSPNGKLISNDRITAIVQDRAGMIWVGTRQGINRINPTTREIEQFFRNELQSSDDICGIVVDHDGILWVCSRSGIVRIDPQKMDIKAFDLSDEFPSSQFMHRSGYVDDDGEIYFGQDDGYVRFDPKNIRINRQLSPVVIESVSTVDENGQLHPRRLSDGITLSHDQSTLAFSFMYPDFSDVSRNKYQYKLEGLHDSWFETDTRSTVFHKIPAGDYSLLLKGANSDGIWNETPTEFQIEILPPFWSTLGFRISMVILAAFILGAAYLVRIRFLQKQRMLLEEEIDERKNVELSLEANRQKLRSLAAELTLAEERERRRLSNSLHDDIGHALIASKLKLSNWLDESIPTELNSDLTKVIRSIEGAISKTRDLTAEISPPSLYRFGFGSAAAGLVEKFSEDYKIKTTLSVDEAANPGEEIAILLYQALRELLINVVKHSKADAVKLTTMKVDERMRVILQDNGIGFDKAALSGGDAKSGFGLFSINERLHTVGGHLIIDSSPGKGSKVTMDTPLTLENEEEGLD